MAKSVLDKAAGLHARRRYGEVVSILEPQLPIYRESERFYYLLGLACLRTGDMGGAHTYLKRAEQLDPRNPDILLCLAALHLRRMETQKAIELYLQVQELRPGDRLAARCLAFMRRSDLEEVVPRLIESASFDRFYPRLRAFPRGLVAAAVCAAVLLVAWALFPYVAGLYGSWRASASPRPEIAAITLSDADRASPVETGGQYALILTDKEALAAFENAKSLFEAYRDNAALVQVNRLLLSNASPSLKEKARTLKSFVSPPDFRTVRDVPSYADVARTPALYEGCAIRWQGTAANVENDQGRLAFHFLVGYVDGKHLDGIVPVAFAEPQGILVGSSPFELLAVVHADGAGIRLDGVAIHTLRPEK
jgi:tetratricopeptide (TPR) repeat protein